MLFKEARDVTRRDFEHIRLRHLADVVTLDFKAPFTTNEVVSYPAMFI